jgi:hypothetical protein
MASCSAVPPPARWLWIASVSSAKSPVKFCTTSGSLSKVIRNAISLLRRIVRFKKSMAASCSKLSRSRMLLEVSSSRPMRSGRSVSRPKNRMSCGIAVFEDFEISLVQVGDEAPVLVRHGDHQMHQARRDADRRQLILIRRWFGIIRRPANAERPRLAWPAGADAGAGACACECRDVTSTTNTQSGAIRKRAAFIRAIIETLSSPRL